MGIRFEDHSHFIGDQLFHRCLTVPTKVPVNAQYFSETNSSKRGNLKLFWNGNWKKLFFIFTGKDPKKAKKQLKNRMRYYTMEYSGKRECFSNG